MAKHPVGSRRITCRQSGSPKIQRWPYPMRSLRWSLSFKTRRPWPAELRLKHRSLFGRSFIVHKAPGHFRTAFHPCWPILAPRLWNGHCWTPLRVSRRLHFMSCFGRLDEAKAVYDLWRDSRLAVMVGMSCRFFETFVRQRQMADEDRHGNLLSVEAHYNGDKRQGSSGAWVPGIQNSLPLRRFGSGDADLRPAQLLFSLGWDDAPRGRIPKLPRAFCREYPRPKQAEARPCGRYSCRRHARCDEARAC